MSALTKEILNIRIKWGKHPDRNLPPKNIYAMFDYIDRLVAENESWKGKANFACEAVINLTNELKAKEDNLTALLEEVDDILIHRRTDVVAGWACIPIGEWDNIERRLNSVVQKIKEGKG